MELLGRILGRSAIVLALISLGPQAGAGVNRKIFANERCGLSLVWHTDIGWQIGRQIAVAEGRVALGTGDRRVMLLNLTSGQELWERKLESGTQAGVSLVGRRLLGVSDLPGGSLFCLDADNGRDVWRRRLGESWGAPLVADERVYAAAVQGRVVACSLATGGEIWRAEAPGRIRAPLTRHDSLLIVPTVSDTLVAYATATGRFVWGAKPGGALYGPAVLADGLLWSLAYEGRLTGWDPVSGKEDCRLNLEGCFRAGLAADDQRAYALSTGGSLLGIDLRQRSVVWRRELASAADLAPALGTAAVWVGLRDGSVRAFDPTDGEPLCELKVPGAPSAPVVLAEPYVLVGTEVGEVVVCRLLREDQGLIPPPAEMPRLPADDPHPRETQELRRKPRLAWGGPSGFAACGWRDSPGRLAPSGGGGLSYARDACSDPEVTGGRAWSWGGGGLAWAAGWLVGIGAALWLQDQADDAYRDYERTGSGDAREAAWDRTRRYDRGALGAWVGAQLCFVLALRAWMTGD